MADRVCPVAPSGAYVRFTMLDVRFINNVRVAQIFQIINAC